MPGVTVLISQNFAQVCYLHLFFFYMLLNVENLLDKINAELPPDIRVFGKHTNGLLHKKNNNVVFEQVREKPSCKSTEDGYLEDGNFGFRK